MKLPRDKAAKMAVAVLGGGVIMGTLMAMTVPTRMLGHSDDTWRERAEATYGTNIAQDGTISTSSQAMFNDASWSYADDQTDKAWREYDSGYPAIDDTQFQDTPFQPSADGDLQDEPASNPPAAVTNAATGDAFGASAAAAQAAAADVRAVENAAGTPDSAASTEQLSPTA